ncbi:MAG: ATP-binding protein [Thermoanaerobaculia bacterium]
MGQDTFKIAFIGSHGVGKTTLCYGLAARLKRLDVSLDVVHEIARRCPLAINRETTVSAQAWILHTQIAEELVASSLNEMVICDRSVLDNFVYLLLAAGPQPALEELVHTWIASYDLLIQVPIYEAPRPDGLRSTDPGFQKAVHDRLQDELARRQLGCLDLAGIDRDDWLDKVEKEVRDQLRPAQLDLLEPFAGLGSGQSKPPIE